MNDENHLFGPRRINSGSSRGGQGHAEYNDRTIWKCVQCTSVRTFSQENIKWARDTIAAFLGCSPEEWVFTGGGTESDNLALYGAVAAVAQKGNHIITSAIEHHAVLHTCEELEKEGFKVTYLPVDSTGRVSVADVEAAVQEDTVLISVMYANNEVGTVQPIQEIGQLARERGILFHVDAVQALGALPITLRELPVDYMSFTAHKINGPGGSVAFMCGVEHRCIQDSTVAFRSAADEPEQKI